MLRDQLRELPGHRVAHGVGDVHRGRPRGDAGLQKLVQVLDVRAAGVHGRELDVVAVALGLLDAGHRHVQDLLRIAPELVHHLYVGAGDEDVYPRVCGVLDGGPRLLHVIGHAAGEGRDDGPADLRAYGLHSLEVAGRAGGEAGLDHVDAEPVQLLRYLQLLLCHQPNAGRLLAVPQRRVKDYYLVVGCHGFWLSSRQLCSTRYLRPCTTGLLKTPSAIDTSRRSLSQYRRLPAC